MSTARMTIRLPPELHDRLSEYSREVRHSKSEVVREALEQYLARLDQGPSCYDVALKAGFIGCFNSGKGDLSTNPRYMEGFGESTRRRRRRKS